jgi:hypothetical protein
MKRMDDDSKNNVIKLGELLFGLSFVSPAHANTAPLVGRLTQQLSQAVVRNNGWGYFLSDMHQNCFRPRSAIRGLAGKQDRCWRATPWMVDVLRRAETRALDSVRCDDSYCVRVPIDVLHGRSG